MELPFYLKSVFTTAISASPAPPQLPPPDAGDDAACSTRRSPRSRPRPAAPPSRCGLGNLHRFAPYPWRRGKRFGSRLRGRVIGQGAEPASSRPRELARAAAVAALRGEGRLDPARMRSAALYDPARLDRACSTPADAAPRGVDWTLLGRLVTAELALEAVDAGLD